MSQSRLQHQMRRKLQIGTPLIDNAENMKPLSIAVEELYEGKVKIVSNGDDSEIM